MEENNSIGPCQTMPPPALVNRAIRLSYAQVMLNAVFGASTGGMFLIGFAMRLGADDMLLGLMSTVPGYLVLFQFVSAALIERGVSRKKMVVIFSLATPLCWFCIAAIPFFHQSLSKTANIAMLIGVICLVSLAGQFAGNARSSWVGELIPAERRGRFFGYCTTFAGIIASLFAVAEGRFLDVVSNSASLFAFAALFFFGALFGLGSGLLNIPQPDCPLPGAGKVHGVLRHIRDTVKNKAFVSLALAHGCVALGAIAGPFNAAYSLRDVGLSFFNLGLLNAVGTAALLITSPFWGHLVDRFGGKPVMVLGLLIMAPCAAVWLFIPPGAASAACWLLPWTNFISNAGAAAFGVAVNTLVYKFSNPHGRSVQFAVYSTFVALLAAPMPTFGGWVVTALREHGLHADLRLTFYAWSFFMFLAAFIASRIHEPGALLTRSLAVSLPNRMGLAFRSAASSVWALFSPRP